MMEDQSPGISFLCPEVEIMFRREMGLAKYNQKKEEGWVREKEGMLAVGRVDFPVEAV